MTRDLDLVVELEPADAERLVALVGDQFECDVHAIRATIARRSMFNLIHTDAIVKVDFVVRKRVESSIGANVRRSLNGFSSRFKVPWVGLCRNPWRLLPAGRS